jgi:hypothetical protein
MKTFSGFSNGSAHTLPKETRNDVTLRFSKSAAERPEKISEENNSKALAILVDGRLIFAPTMNG